MKKCLRYIMIAILLLLAIVFSIPIPNHDLDYSKILLDQDGQLLSAKISQDQQWRFPLDKDIPKALADCITLFEDEYFYKHIGINPISLAKAAKENYKAKKIVRGGSTITMQVMRMYRGNKSRTYTQKLIEILGAIKLEMLHSKSDIINIWASIAPFGGNTIGASTASWRYYNRPLGELSIAEYATLTVLPNAPTAIHMTKNVDKLIVKRNALLKKLLDKKVISQHDYELAIFEDIIFNTEPIPMHSTHLLDHLISLHPNQNIFKTTINKDIQLSASAIVQSFSDLYQYDGIDNAAVVIMDYIDNKLVSYIGNTTYKDNKHRYVNCAHAPRSYGSLLKPFLYTYAIDEGYFLPKENIKDIPTNIDGFTPKNFDKNYRGYVPLDKIITHSLNVPAVRVLNYVGGQDLYNLLKDRLQLSHLNNNYDHHGLSLILGGAEANLYELTNAYKGLLRNYNKIPYPYSECQTIQNQNVERNQFAFDPVSVAHTIKAMTSVNRPKEEQHYNKMDGQKIAWKTGTSYGHRDAWSIGANGRYIVGIWVGNEDGRGIHNLTGGIKAAPILFRLMRLLESEGGIDEVVAQGEKIEVCIDSGQSKGRLCNNTRLVDIPNHHHRIRQCTHHHLVEKDTLFSMSPTEEYYKSEFAGHQHISTSGNLQADKNVLDIVYPQDASVIFIPKKLDAEYSQVKLVANSLNKESSLFWFLNDEHFSKTTEAHHTFAELSEGNYTLEVHDDRGQKKKVSFEVRRRH